MFQGKLSVITKRMVIFFVIVGIGSFITLLYGDILDISNTKVLTPDKATTVSGLVNNVLESGDELKYKQFALDNNLDNKTGFRDTLKQCIYKLKINESETNIRMNIGQSKNSSLLTKVQAFLSSLPNEDKNSSQFIAIQNYLDKLIAQTVSSIIENKTSDNVANLHKSDSNHNQGNITSGNEAGSSGKGTETTTTVKETRTIATIISTEKQYCDKEKYLIGRQTIAATVNVHDVKNPEALGRVRKGGTYKPEDCRPRDSVAIIIPYRDRQKHLEIFINHMHSFLQRQQLQYGIFVVEIARPTTFNRGLLANVGFLAAQSTGLYSCYVIHDVDLIPINDRNIYSCSDQFRHLSVGNPKFNNGLPYNDYAGGVVALREDVYVKSNGFSNIYFGWGGEDDDFLHRARAENYQLERPTKEEGAYVALPHGKDASNPANPERFKLVAEGSPRRLNDGLNSMNYEQLSSTPLDLYTLVYARVNKTEVLQTNVVGHVGDAELYESDLKTLNKKHAVNEKIINAYFWILQEKSNGKISVMKPTFKYQKKPWFPVTLNSSKTELLFLPLKQYGYWNLMIIFCKEQSFTYLDPTGNNKMETEFIRSEYQSQFGIALSEKTDFRKAITYDKDENYSGVLIMMYAKRIVEGKPLSFEQEEIETARGEIGVLLRR